MRRSSVVASTLAAIIVAVAPSRAFADDEPKPEEAKPAGAKPADPQAADTQPADAQPADAQPAGANAPNTLPTSAPGSTSDVPVAPVQSTDRSMNLEPKAVKTPPAKISFAADPIADGGIIIGAASFAGLLEMINSTGELRPQQIAPNFDTSSLLWLDRGAVNQTVDDNAKMRSNIGLFSAVGFAVLDPILTGYREHNVQAALVDGIIYAEALSVTLGVTNLAKIAVRRPRPQAYIDAEAHKNDPTWSNADTDSTLSFFSGHASITATVGATATYLAFARAPNLWRPLVTLGVSTAVTTFTSVERVRGGAHFPTDVIAGALAGAGIGVIVAHIHRSEDVKQRRVWVGFAPERDDGGVVQVGGLF